MRDYTDVSTIYMPSFKTIRLKIDPLFIASDSGSRLKATNNHEVCAILRAIFDQLDDDQEHFVILTLNIANDVTGFKVISSGTQTSNRIDSKLVFRNAILLGATSIMMAHNHPSGQIGPSQPDLQFTQKMVAAGKSIDLPIQDHFILTHNHCYSMRYEGGFDFS